MVRRRGPPLCKTGHASVHVKEHRYFEGCQAGDAVSLDSEWNDRKNKYKGAWLSL